MAFRTQKISQMTPKGADLEATDLIEVSTIESGSYVTRSITGQELIDAIPPTTIEWGDIGGTLSAQTDLNTALNARVPTSRTLTINGVTQDLSADRTFTISTGLTVGTTPIASGTIGRVLFQGTGNVLQQSSSLFWDSTNNRLGIGTDTPTTSLMMQQNGASFIRMVRNLSTTEFGMFITNVRNGVGQAGGVFTANNFEFRNSADTSAFLTINGGNVLINTTTDAGFRLDVNGTARVQGNTTISGADRFLIVNNTSTGLMGLIYQNASVDQAYIGIASSNNSGLNGSLTHDYFIRSLNRRILFGTSSAIQAMLFNTGNFAINTTTDAGFRLDVNGTARVQGDLTIGSGNGFLRGNNNFVNIFSPTDQVQVFVSARGAVSGTLGYFGNTELKASGGVSNSSIGISQTNAFVAISQGSVNNINTESFVVNRGFFANVGATDKNLLRVSSTFNSNVTNGTLLRGIYVDINDTTTFTGFADFRAIESPRGGAYFNTTSVNASAILQADSTTKGFLPPRMTGAQAELIPSPAEGLMVYATAGTGTTITSKGWWGYDGATWVKFN